MNFSDDFLDDDSFSYFDNEILKSKVQKCKEYVSTGQTIAFFDNIEETIQLCLEYDFTEDGIYLTDAALEISPYSSDLWHTKGIFFNNLFEFEKAYLCFDKAISLNPNDVETMINKSIAEDNLGFWHEAVQTLENALALEPDNEEILFNLGIFYERNDSFEKAINYFEQTIALDEEYGDAWYELGFCYENNNQLIEALKAYKKFMDIDPYSASGWYNFGIVHLKLGNYADAINNFELAIAINEEFVNAWYNLGIAYTKTSHFIDARKSFFKAYELDPTDYSIPLSIAQTFEAIGDYEKASQYYDETIKINRGCVDAYLGLGNFFARKNNQSEMIKYFSLFIKYSLAHKIKNSTSDEMNLIVSEMMIEIINLESIENRTEEKSLELAELFFDLGNFEKSAKIYTKLLENALDRSEIFYGLAFCNLFLGNNKLAIENLITSFEINPNSEKIFFENFPLLELTQLYINIFNSIY